MPNRRILILLIGVAIATLCMLLFLHEAQPENPLSTNVGRRPYTVLNTIATVVTFAIDLMFRH